MGLRDACVRENPIYSRTICVFCKATVCTRSLGKRTSLRKAEELELQKVKAHCEQCKEYQRVLSLGRVGKGQHLVKFKTFIPKEFK